MLGNINSQVTETSLGSSLTLTGLEKMLRFTTSLSTSFYQTKYNFWRSSPQYPSISHWNPNLASCGNIARTRVTSSLVFDSRDDVLLPAQGREHQQNIINELSFCCNLDNVGRCNVSEHFICEEFNSISNLPVMFPPQASSAPPDTSSPATWCGARSATR